ncbi:hypothetical protein HELRODRAFT_175768 [Helobdella robusta]|uniref:Uncharacterized protein n=1 Tax=Helobdella robusta TaxID=6412 RepID=T1F9M6_HELRO|nr:hypothetical protein HELRODRAFT_175768 [Helobdella robusta]ESO00358.1 hypothetical protein HELRODRAFT_175768 [Helobdella robusta]
MWDEFLSICRSIFETKVEDKFPCFLADDLWKVTNCDIKFEKLSAKQVRLQKSVIQNGPAVLEFLEEHGNILSDVQKKVNSIVCSDVCADGDSDAETSVAKNLSDIAEEGNNDGGNFMTMRIVEISSSWPDYVQVMNWVFNNNSKSGSTRNVDVNVRTCSDVKR